MGKYLYYIYIPQANAIIQTSCHMQTLGINPQKGFIIGGVSAGANLAAVVAHLYRDEKHLPPLTGQYLSIPTTCDPEALPSKYKDVYLSREQNKEGLILNKNSIDMFESKLSFLNDYMIFF